MILVQLFQMLKILLKNFLKKANYSHHGLPNIGNSCFLNSTLQILFAAQKLREQIIEISKSQDQKLVFHRYIADVFEDIIYNKSIEKKRQDLNRLTTFINSKHPQIIQFQQNDAFECLLAILNILDEEYPNKSKLDFFKIQYESQCSCQDQPNYMQDYVLVPNKNCSLCKHQIKCHNVSSGPYLIVLPKDTLYPQISFNSGSRYSIKGFNLYFGNKINGHYISIRKQEGQWLEINDGEVQNSKKNYIDEITPMIALYQKEKLAQEELIMQF